MTMTISPPGQAHRLARESLRLAVIAACIYGLWTIAAILLPILSGPILVTLFNEWALAFIVIGLQLRGIPLLPIFVLDLWALIVGIQALAQIRKNGGGEEDRRAATTGTWLAAGGLLAALALVAIMALALWSLAHGGWTIL